MEKTIDLLIERLNERVKPLVATVTNYFAGRIEDEDIAAAVMSLQLGLKNWEELEEEFGSPAATTEDMTSFKLKRAQEPPVS